MRERIYIDPWVKLMARRQRNRKSFLSNPKVHEGFGDGCSSRTYAPLGW